MAAHYPRQFVLLPLVAIISALLRCLLSFSGGFPNDIRPVNIKLKRVSENINSNRVAVNIKFVFKLYILANLGVGWERSVFGGGGGGGGGVDKKMIVQ